MNMYSHAHSELNRLESRIELRQVVLALLIIVLVAAAFGLTALGLDALNDMMARGFSSLGNPSN